ncbi:unnamed protein product [Cyprideis torosa]|uniref:Uncharacterized protein n=1 Tax=Cyprideis torosa TaxID=163714 RepID=A0A7R8ZLY1_9CRUS|nr:unnamed protein product [Cyprideis torosa]CAG0883131.1 unnamed protein product [Cyprideis torosa]
MLAPTLLNPQGVYTAVVRLAFTAKESLEFCSHPQVVLIGLSWAAFDWHQMVEYASPSVSKLEVSFAKPTDALDNDVTWGNSIITERDPIVSSTTPCIRNVTVTLGGFVTWAVKFAIHIKGTFLYLTEVEFASTPVNGTEETNSASGSEESLDPRYVAFLSPDLEETGVAVQQGSPTDAALLVSGLIAFSLLILGVTVSLVFWKRRSLPKPVWLRGQGPLDFSPVICPGGKGYLRKVDQDGTDSQRLSRPFSLPDGTSTLPRGSSLGSLLMDGPLGLHHPHCCHYQTSYVSQPSQMGPPPPSQTVLGYSAMCSRSSRDITLSSPESYQEAYSVEYASPLLSRATPASGKQPVSRENGNNASDTNPRTRLPLGQRRSLSSTFKPTAKSHEDQAYASTDILKMSDSTRPLSSHGRPNFAHTHQQLYFLTQDSAGGPLGLSPVFPSPKPSKSLACIPERC